MNLDYPPSILNHLTSQIHLTPPAEPPPPSFEERMQQRMGELSEKIRQDNEELRYEKKAMIDRVIAEENIFEEPRRQETAAARNARIRERLQGFRERQSQRERVQEAQEAFAKEFHEEHIQNIDSIATSIAQTVFQENIAPHFIATVSSIKTLRKIIEISQKNDEEMIQRMDETLLFLSEKGASLEKRYELTNQLKNELEVSFKETEKQIDDLNHSSDLLLEALKQREKESMKKHRNQFLSFIACLGATIITGNGVAFTPTYPSGTGGQIHIKRKI